MLSVTALGCRETDTRFTGNPKEHCMALAQGEEPSRNTMSELEGLGSTFDLQVGRHIALHGSFRMSPTGLISSGIAAAVILLALGHLASALRRPEH